MTITNLYTLPFRMRRQGRNLFLFKSISEATITKFIPNHYRKSIADLNPKKQFEVTLTSCSIEVNKWIEKHIFSQRNLEEMTVGLDCEWKPENKYRASKVALLQIATDHSVLLVKMLKINHPLPTNLVSLVSSMQIAKAGVGIYDDLVKLRNDYGIPIGRYVDLGDITARKLNLRKSIGMRTIVEMHFGKVKPVKNRSITMSDWSRDILTDDQILYASYDALWGRLIFDRLKAANELSPEIISNIIIEMRGVLLASVKTGGLKKEFRRCSRLSAESTDFRRAFVEAFLCKDFEILVMNTHKNFTEVEF